MIEYQVIDVIKAVLRRWYIVILIILVFCLASIPVAHKSYEQAIRNYNKLVKEPSKEAGETLSFCVMMVETNYQTQISAEVAASIVYRLLSDDQVKNVINSNIQKEVSFGSGNIIDRWEITLLEDSNIILFASEKFKEQEFKELILILAKELETDLNSLIGTQVNIRLGEVKSYAGNNNSFAEAIIKEPNKPASYVKTMITSSILGCLIGLMFVLFLEYLSANKKERAGRDI